MYAVVKTGGKQYKVAENDLLRIEKVEAEAGSIITLDNVLLVANDNDVTVGSPIVEGASVAVEVLAQRRARKIIVFKKRRRKSSRTKNGHRQHFTLVRISEILTNGAKPSKPAIGMPAKAELTVVSDDDAPEAKPAKAKKASAKKAQVEDATPAEATSEEKPKAKRTTKKASDATEGASEE